MDPAELSPKAGGGESAAAEELIRRVEELEAAAALLRGEDAAEAAAHGLWQELDAERPRPPPSGGRLHPIPPPPHPAVGMSSSPSPPAPGSPPGSARLRAGSSSPAPLSPPRRVVVTIRPRLADRDAFEERGDVFLHPRSPPKGKNIARCMICWRRERTCTVASARQKCFCLVLLGSVYGCWCF